MNDTFNSQRTETEKWRLCELESQTLLDEAEEHGDGQNFVNSMWPFLNPYYSPLNAVFTPSFKKYFASMSSRAEEKTLLLRDGAVPMTWFFGTHPPETRAGRFLVHETLGQRVPGEWRSRVNLYRVSTTPLKAPRSLILAGPISERVCSVAHVERTLDKVEEQLGRRRMRAMKVKMFCPIRGDGELFPAKYLQAVLSRFDKVEIVDWYQIQNIGNVRGVAFVEFNEGWIYQDSFVQHHLLSRGASLLLRGKPVKKSRQIPLSRFHYAEVMPVHGNGGRLKERDHQLLSFYTQAAKGRDNPQFTLWPEWHEKWCRAAE